MSSVNPNSKLVRPTPFTPKRTATTTSLERLSRATVTPNLLASTHKKYKAPISGDVKRRAKTPTPTTLAPVPGSRPSSPTKSDNGRPTTPGTPRRGTTPDPSLVRATSEMDVSNVDPEEVLVDYQTVEPADVSLGEMDEAWLKTMQADHGKQDKVMVSVRLRPGENSASAWIPSVNTNTISLDPSLSQGKSPSPSYTFDAILTGTPNKPIFTTVAKSHVIAAVEGFNSVIFAYGQTASGKTYTLSGSEDEPGIIPRAMRQVFGYIRKEERREYLLRCSYLEIYNEQIHDLLAPPGAPNKVEIHGASAGDVILTPLREEVITSIKGVRDVLKRGESHRRTACTDWNERSSRSHSVFRLVIESRERADSSPSGRATPSGRQTPGANPNHGGPRLQSRGGKSVQTSVLSLIDLAGSEKATSDKERTREGQYINKSLLTLGTVIGKLSDNAAKGKTDHIPFRDSKLTRLLAPSLSGNARISVVCTINPDPSAVTESTSTLLFAKRVKGVKLQAQKREVVDRDALIERYEKEIVELRRRLEERERDSIGGDFSIEGSEETKKKRTKPRMSVQEKVDESQAMKDLQGRIAQLTKLILNSQTVSLTDSGEVGDGDETRPVSPSKPVSATQAAGKVAVDFDMDSYELHQALLNARLQISSQATQILSLEAAMAQAAATVEETSASPEDGANDKDKVIEEQARRIRELEEHHTYHSMNYDNIDEKLVQSTRKLEEKQLKIVSLEKSLAESRGKVAESNQTLLEKERKLNEKERWAEELVKQLEKEKRIRIQLEDERRVLRKFVERFDELGMGSSLTPASTLSSPAASLAGRRRSSLAHAGLGVGLGTPTGAAAGQRRSSFAYGHGSGIGGSSLRQPLFPSSASSSSTSSESSSTSTSLSRFTSASPSLTSISSSGSVSSTAASSPSGKPRSEVDRFRESYSPMRLPSTPHGVGDVPRLLDLPTPDFKEAWASSSGSGDVSFEFEYDASQEAAGAPAAGKTGLGGGGSRVPSVAGGMTGLVSGRTDKPAKSGAGTVRFASSVGILGEDGEEKENVTPHSRE